MQVDTNVSESGVGGVRIGLPVDFTVGAYGAKVFQGSVVQVRKAPITVQNVVTYDVVATVSNPDLLLMPGMTANVSVIIARRDNVLRVPLRALSFLPRRHGQVSPGNQEFQQSDGGSTRVWLEADGKLRPRRIVRGLDDGAYVEVVDGDLKPDEAVVIDAIGPHPAASNHSFAGGPHFPHM